MKQKLHKVMRAISREMLLVLVETSFKRQKYGEDYGGNEVEELKMSFLEERVE